MATQSEQLGQDAEQATGQQLTEQVAITLKRNASRLRLFAQGNPDLFSKADAGLRNRLVGGSLSDEDYRTLGKEMLNKRTFLGKKLEEITIPGDNGASTTMASMLPESVNDIPSLVNQSVAQNTGDIGFLQGATIWQAIRGLFSWLMSGFKDGFDGLKHCIAQCTADDVGTDLRQNMTAKGYSADIVDKTVKGVQGKILTRAGVPPAADVTPTPTLEETKPAPLQESDKKAIKEHIRPQIADSLGLNKEKPISEATQVNLNLLALATRGHLDRNKLCDAITDVLAGVTAQGITDDKVIKTALTTRLMNGDTKLDAASADTVAKNVVQDYKQTLAGQKPTSQQKPAPEALTKDLQHGIKSTLSNLGAANGSAMNMINQEALSKLLAGSAARIASDTDAQPPVSGMNPAQLQEKLQGQILKDLPKHLSTLLKHDPNRPAAVVAALNTPEARNDIAAAIAANYMQPGSKEAQASLQKLEDRIRPVVGEQIQAMISSRVKEGINQQIDDKIDQKLNGGSWAPWDLEGFKNKIEGIEDKANLTLINQDARTYAEANGLAPAYVERKLISDTVGSAVSRVLTDPNWRSLDGKSLAELPDDLSLKFAMRTEILNSVLELKKKQNITSLSDNDALELTMNVTGGEQNHPGGVMGYLAGMGENRPAFMRTGTAPVAVVSNTPPPAPSKGPSRS